MTTLKAVKKGFWKNDYEISVDGRPLTGWNAKTWRSGGSFELDGRPYEVRANAWATRWEMTDQTGMEVATASRVGRKRWMVEAEGRAYAFQRASSWRLEEHLIVDGQPAGSVKRANLFRDDAVADLPGLPLHLQVFTLLVVLSGWDIAAAASG